MTTRKPQSQDSTPQATDTGRRRFLGAGGAAMAAAVAVPTILTAARALPQSAPPASPDQSRGKPIRIGVIGCGGRGTGAAMDALHASPDCTIVAVGDVFPDRVQGAAAALKEQYKERGTVPAGRQFAGFDSCDRVMATDCDLVILATPPGFRPQQFAKAIAAGKHVFFEKPVAVDPTGVRTVLEAADLAGKKKLCVVTGTQRRHQRCYQEAMAKVRDGAIGKPVAARCYWNQGGLWHKDPDPSLSEIENQIRNWLYYTWLSGDHIVEQHVHNLDVVNWAMDAHPVKAIAVGGRQARTQPAFGTINDHFAVDLEYPGDRFAASMCRQQDGTDGRVDEIIYGTEGVLYTRPGYAEIRGAHPWKFTGKDNNPYVTEHVDLQESVRGNAAYVNEGARIAESTMTAILGRMAAYTGKDLEWQAALASDMNLVPAIPKAGPAPASTVAIPGRA
ncbi:MAG: Gfo/Idh/MocA family oxidoreductase [Phycisphaerales bacterium]